MDWLRIGAFAVLIVYHIGMVFVPWHYHVNSARPVDWVTALMLFANPWRLTLLFVVSGFASRALWMKLGPKPQVLDASDKSVSITGRIANTLSGARRFLANRSWRLLVPLFFGIAVVVPPQAWVELTTQRGYNQDYWTFWSQQYWLFGKFGGIILPTWNHLWFVAYLFIYTLVMVAIAVLPGGKAAQRTFDWLFAGSRVLWLPAAYLLMTQVVVFQRWSDSQDVINDGIAHLAYFPAFMFGFALAGSPLVMRWLAYLWKPAMLMALAAYATTAAIDIIYNGRMPWLIARTMLAARYIHAWMMIAALIGMADACLNRDHKWRQTLAEGVFPFYLIHQTIIVVVMYWLLKASLHPGIEFVVLIAATVAGCWIFYRVGREIRWLRPLIGLRMGPSNTSA